MQNEILRYIHKRRFFWAVLCAVDFKVRKRYCYEYSKGTVMSIHKNSATTFSLTILSQTLFATFSTVSKSASNSVFY